LAEHPQTKDEATVDEMAIRTRIITELLESLSESRKIMLDHNIDLKTRDRWTQLHNNTSQKLNTVLKDLQTKDWENRLRQLEEDWKIRKTKSLRRENPDHEPAQP
jgi:hypothetical protein